MGRPANTIPRVEGLYVEKTHGCWNWRGSLHVNGYGKFRMRDAHVFAHRAFFEHYKGPIGAGLQIDHLCRNRACCNPGHLEAVTPRENSLRSFSPAAINARKAHCLRGHSLAPANVYLTSRGQRHCRECSRIRQREYQNRSK